MGGTKAIKPHAEEISERRHKRVIPIAWLGANRCPHYRTYQEPCATCVPPDIEAHREFAQYGAPIHPEAAELLGIAGGTLMLVRRIKLFVAGKPVLTAVSFVPPEVFDEIGDAWRDVAVDALAVTGGHTLISWGYTAVLNDVPATTDCAVFGHAVGSGAPITLYVEPHKVRLGDCRERTRQAGLTLLVRRDRAWMVPQGRYQRLVLRRKFIKSLRTSRQQR